MGVEIICRKFWTYNIGIPASKRQKSEKKLPLDYLNEHECTHIHGELQIIIDGRILPHLGYYSADDVCIGYWIEKITNMLTAFQSDIHTYIIEGCDQGQPDYKFENENGDIYLSIVASPMDGKKDLNWQKIKFGFGDFKQAFYEFQESLLSEISLKSPGMLEIWRNKFPKGNIITSA